MESIGRRLLLLNSMNSSMLNFASITTSEFNSWLLNETSIHSSIAIYIVAPNPRSASFMPLL